MSMGDDAPAAGLPPALERITRALAIAGGMLMLAAAAMVTASVLMRWFMFQSIQGDIELVQIATALSVFAFLPLCQARRGNIMVDTFTNWLPLRARRMLDGAWDIVYAGVAAVIAWRLAVGAADMFESRTVSMMLGLPVGWAIALCALIAGLLAVVALATAWRPMRTPS